MCDINDQNLQTAAKLCTESGAKAVSTRIVNIRNAKEVDDWIADILKTHGRLDGAANIAGVSQRPGTTGLMDLKDTADESWKFVLGVNATGTFNCLRAELRVMKSGAAIVNCSSVAGLIGTPGAAGYVAGQA